VGHDTFGEAWRRYGGPGAVNQFGLGFDDHMFLAEMALTMFQNSPDAIVVVDDDGLIRLVNEQATLMFGYPRHELIDKSIDTLLPEDVRGRHADHRAGYAANPGVRPMGPGRVLKALRKDGQEIEVEISLGPAMTNHGLFIIATIRRARGRA